MATAKRKAIDHFRRSTTFERKYASLTTDQEYEEMPEPDEDLGDDLLRLIFIACHPVLSQEARVVQGQRGELAGDRPKNLRIANDGLG